MSYEAALKKAWAGVDEALKGRDRHEVVFMGDAYDIDVKKRLVLSVSCNTPAKDYLTIIILHYLAASSKNAFVQSGEWVSFKDIDGGEIYYPAFREGAIKPLLRKYGSDPEGILKSIERLGGKRVEVGDVGIEVPAFKDIPVRVAMWKGDEEFGPEATMLFDRNITKLYPMEDVAVLSRFIAHSL